MALEGLSSSVFFDAMWDNMEESQRAWAFMIHSCFYGKKNDRLSHINEKSPKVNTNHVRGPTKLTSDENTWQVRDTGRHYDFLNLVTKSFLHG